MKSFLKAPIYFLILSLLWTGVSYAQSVEDTSSDEELSMPVESDSMPMSDNELGSETLDESSFESDE
ncbi:MAG: hypothetical protein CME66_10030 [Halobacteriovoraceae bacterium]|jgi:hypothetical protein|nr:hypothetical protein [Halobacteriovoraceae bacterium]|tara:strand:- start:75 stop:275 length:201 start_codon:yes stop_codon:yes gene_type:complete